ncbi:hypothetical protein [Acinetobacter sp. HY1485]|uniref:hypothetical protein n=1 Tax=Acinetobacter sp. HY1485 TaxID=2970918 RepID=UPI0022B97D69|nr:hypothetical protein [Acinetobacter sp. HY1485]
MQQIKRKTQQASFYNAHPPATSELRITFKDVLIANLIDLFKGVVVIVIMFVLYVVISYALSSLIWGV